MGQPATCIFVNFVIVLDAHTNAVIIWVPISAQIQFAKLAPATSTLTPNVATLAIGPS